MTIDQIAQTIRETDNAYVRVYAGTRQNPNRYPVLNTSDWFAQDEVMTGDKASGVFSRQCEMLPPGSYVVRMKRNRQAKDDTERELPLEIGMVQPGVSGVAIAAPGQNISEIESRIEARLNAQFEFRIKEMKYANEKKELEKQIQDLKDEKKYSDTWGAKLNGLVDHVLETHLPTIISGMMTQRPAAIMGFESEAPAAPTLQETITGDEIEGIDEDSQATDYLNEISEKIGDAATLELLRKLSTIDGQGLEKLLGISDAKIKGLLLMF